MERRMIGGRVVEYRKWTREQQATVVSGYQRGLSCRAAGRLVSDADGTPMPRSVVRALADKARARA